MEFHTIILHGLTMIFDRVPGHYHGLRALSTLLKMASNTPYYYPYSYNKDGECPSSPLYHGKHTSTIHTSTIKHLTKLKIAQYKTHKLIKTFPHIVAEHLIHIILDKHKLVKRKEKQSTNTTRLNIKLTLGPCTTNMK